MNIPLNIDWQQILLHMFNFVILAGGLYLLLYKPVKEFMDKRRDHYRQLDEEAARKLAEAEELKRACQERLQRAQEEIDARKAEARSQAEEAARQELARAKAQGDQIVAGARAAARRAQEKAVLDSQQQLKELASAALEKLVYQSTGEAYERFLGAAEEVERRADET